MKYVDNKIVYEVGDWVIAKEKQFVPFKASKVISCDDYGVRWEPNNRTACVFIRPATQEEIDKILQEEKIMLGEYEVKFDKIIGEEILVRIGDVIMYKEDFLKIGKKAKWID